MTADGRLGARSDVRWRWDTRGRRRTRRLSEVLSDARLSEDRAHTNVVVIPKPLRRLGEPGEAT